MEAVAADDSKNFRELMAFFLLFVATCFLAYSNGANDNFKGVASLFGSRTCNYRTAISWATITTFAGSIMSIFLAQALLKKFSGKGIVPDHFVGSEYFLLAVAVGAGLTVIIATLTGFPISTTHALTGAIIGCGLVAVGSQVNFSALGKGFLLPLLVSPVLAMAMAGVLYIAFHALRVVTGTNKEWCICVGTEERVVAMPQPANRERGAFSQRRNRELRTRIKRYAENCRTSPRVENTRCSLGFRRGRTGNGARRFAQCEKSGRDNEQKNHGHESRPGLHRESYNCDPGRAGEFVRTSGFNNTCFRRLTFRNRPNDGKSKSPDDQCDRSFLARDTAVRRARRWRKLLAHRSHF